MGDDQNGGGFPFTTVGMAVIVVIVVILLVLLFGGC